MKYVIYEYEEGIKQLFEKYPNLKQYFDNLLGYNLYDLFPSIKDNL